MSKYYDEKMEQFNAETRKVPFEVIGHNHKGYFPIANSIYSRKRILRKDFSSRTLRGAKAILYFIAMLDGALYYTSGTRDILNRIEVNDK